MPDKTISCEYKHLLEPIEIPDSIPIHGTDLPYPLKDWSGVAYKQFLKGNDRFYFIFSMITSLIRIFWLSDKKKLLHNFGHLHAYGSNQFLHDTQSSFSIYKK